MTKMFTKIFVFFSTSFLASSKGSIICPQYSWTAYKTVAEGHWSFVIEKVSGKPIVEFTIRRDTQ